MNLIKANPIELDFQQYTLLIVDDIATNLKVISEYLKNYNFNIMTARSGETALERIRHGQPDIILLDVMMPGIDGFETCRRLKANESTQDIPVIFMTALADTENKLKGFEVGAVDYVTKPLQQEEVLARVTTHLRLRDLSWRLQEKNKHLAELNANKDKFFSDIAHDLHTPFNTLLGNSHLMLKELDMLTPVEQQQLAQHIYTSSLTVHSLVETLMTWSSMQRVQMQYPRDEINLSNLAQQAIELWQDTAIRKNIELTHDIEEELYVCADEIMLGTVMRNLLANALKYTLSGGWVTLSTKSPAVNNGGQQPGEFIAVSVADMGVGISQENMSKLFRIDLPHSTPGTAKETGAGLGLMMCKEMVAYNGGRIWVESEVGRGTSVTFTVPLAELEGCH